MTLDQLIIIVILLLTIIMFLWGKWRHDMVALGALLLCVVTGLISPQDAFAGFGHPAVITVACVLILSRGLQTTGAVDLVAHKILPAKAGITLSMATLVILGAVLSGFMNNVGAMAILMPVAIKLATRLQLKPGQLLMPLAFGTILGGMTTLIGTPPNLIVSGFREQAGLGSFAMFDFSPVGVVVALVGIVFLFLGGWKLVPARKNANTEGFVSGAYFTEARVPQGSKSVGMTISEAGKKLADTDVEIIGFVHNQVRIVTPNPRSRIEVGDILVLKSEVDELASVINILGLKLEEALETKNGNGKKNGKDQPEGQSFGVDIDRATSASLSTQSKESEEESSNTSNYEIVLTELAILPGSILAGRSVSDILLRTRYSLNLLALSRQGKTITKRLRSVQLSEGDLLLIQGRQDAILEFAADNNCVPLAERELYIPNKHKAIQSAAIMGVAVAGAAFGLLPAAIAFAFGVLAAMVTKITPPREIYNAVDWPVIVLLAALIPVAGAMETTGTATLIAQFLIDNLANSNAVLGLAIILIATMLLSDLINNAATAAVMCPIAISSALALGVNADAFLMAVAIGASCAFLTPIGHQNNTLIIGPGGFRFGDYWRLGLCLEIIVAVVSIPVLLYVWPL
jgi:di/tricarboxylate transporter